MGSHVDLSGNICDQRVVLAIMFFNLHQNYKGLYSSFLLMYFLILSIECLTEWKPGPFSTSVSIWPQADAHKYRVLDIVMD